MRAFLKCAVLAVFATLFVACGDNPNGPDYDVQPTAKMAAPDTTAPEVIISDNTPEGDVRMDADGRLHVGVKAVDAGGIKIRRANPCTLKVQCADGSAVVSPRGLSPMSDESDTLWFWGYWDACPKNTTGKSQTVALTVPVVDMAGNVGMDSRILVQSVYTSPDQLANQTVLASYVEVTETETVTKIEKVTNTGGGAGPGSIGTTTVVSSNGHGGSSNHTQPPTQSTSESVVVGTITIPPSMYTLVDEDSEAERLGWEMPICIQVPGTSGCYDGFWKTIGQYAGATDGVDEILWINFKEGMPVDILYPPPPPAEMLDFTLMMLHDGILDRFARDIRSLETTEMVFELWIQYGTYSDATFVWDPKLLPPDAEGEVIDVYLGNRFADIRNGRVTVYPPFDKIKFVVRRGAS